MEQRRGKIDWYSVFLAAFSHDNAVDAASDSPAPEPHAPMSPGGHQRFDEPRDEFQQCFGPGAPVDDGPHFRLTRAATKATVGLGPGVDAPSTSKGVDDFSLIDEDEQGDYVSHEHCSKSSPNFSGQKKNYGQVQDVVTLDDEDMEPKEEVNREMSNRLNEPKIYYPSRDDRVAVDLTRSDIKCLDPGGFLSCHVINFYIKWYIERTRLCKESFGDKFYIFNTYFFEKLEKALDQPHDFQKLRRWWKGANIFNNAYIILPIHAKEHWSLVIICLPPKDRISEPIILHLDSLGMHHSAKILDTVGRYIEKEWRFLSVAEPAWPSLLTDIRKETVQVPQQNNAYDCGVFMLYYIEQFIKEAPARFTADKLDMFSRSWFKPEEASGLRQRIRELLLEEFERARKDDAISKADACEGDDSRKGGELEADDGVNDKKGIVKENSGRSNAEKRGNKPIVIASPERLKGTDEVIRSTPIVDPVSDSGVKRLKWKEEAISTSMPIPDAVCEIWITRVHRRTSGTTLEPGNWCWSSGGSSKDARRKFIEHFSGKYSCPATDVAAEEEQAGEEVWDAVDQASGSLRNGRPIRKTKPNPRFVGPQWA